MGQRFGSGSLAACFQDSLALPGDTIGLPEEAVRYLRFRDETTRLGSLLEVRLEPTGASWLRIRSLLRVSETRTRGDLDVATHAKIGPGTLALENRLNLQGGPDQSGPGIDDLVSLRWNQAELPGRLELTARASNEQSWSGQEILRDLYVYRIVRSSLELGRPLGWTGDLSLRGGTSRRWSTREGRGAWRAWFGEGEWTRFVAGLHRWNLRVRNEHLEYTESKALSPSSNSQALQGRAEVGLGGGLRLAVEPEVARLAYSSTSDLFRDHWTLGGACKLLGDPHRLRNRNIAAGALDTLGLGPTGSPWTVSLGGRGGLWKGLGNHEGEYEEWAALIGISRDATERIWFDFTLEGGRRRYRNVAGTTPCRSGEISLPTSNFTLISTSLLGSATLPLGIQIELFAQLDREYHAAAADDFTLWILNASLSRSF